MSDAGARPFAPAVLQARVRALPWLTVAAGSLLVAIVPIVAPAPLLPPLGLEMLLAWRLLSPFSMRRWAAAPLGLADDLVSGQPLGSAVLLWSLCFLGIELFEQRLVFRTFRHDWAIAAGALAFCLVGGRLLATPLVAAIDVAVAAQIVAAILLFPLAMRLTATLDRRRALA